MFLVREMAGALDDLDPGSRDRPPRILRVHHRNDRVPRPPHHAGRHLPGEIGPVGHGDHLALPVDHCAQHVQERVPFGRIRLALQYAQRAGDVGRAGQPDGVRPSTDQPQCGVHRRGRRDRERRPTPGQGQAPEQGVDLPTEPARGDHHQPLRVLRKLVGELHGDAAAEAVPDHGDLVDAQDGQQVTHTVGETAQAVVGPGFIRLPVAQQVRGDDRVPLGQLLDDRVPGAMIATDPVQ